jgi:hypothetical protein
MGETPSLDSYWRAIVLFGRNVASYKFALGEALLELGNQHGNELVGLDDLALPFATRVADHLKTHDKQGTSSSSQFLDECRRFNRGESSTDQLKDTTVRLGFGNVIDAFHVVDGSDVDERFFIDERSTSQSIRLTDNLHQLLTQADGADLSGEIHARWRLVETAWELNLPSSLLTVQFEPTSSSLVVPRRRTSITPARDALNGYQKGHCFYCYAPISITSGSPDLGEVDHLFAWSIGDHIAGAPIDGVWNLVLACNDCNNWHEKSDRPPDLRYVERLSHRNEYLISSHHPLRPTLIAQTGTTPSERDRTLRQAFNDISAGGVRAVWTTGQEHKRGF